MTEESKSNLKAAAAVAGKGTVRGNGSTIGWGAVIWYFLVERSYGSSDWHILVSARRPADLGTWFIVGILAAVLTGYFRLMEQRHPNSIWSTLLLSQGAPTYDGSTQQPDPGPPTVTVTTDNAQVTVTPPPPVPEPEPAPQATDSPFGVGESEPVQPTVDTGNPPPYTPPISALDDPESNDTSAVFVSTDPADLLEGH